VEDRFTDPAGLAATHSGVGDLVLLLDQLQRRDHVTMGTERAQHAAALLARLATGDVKLIRAETAAAWLGPVLCVTARERHILAERLQSLKAEREKLLAAEPETRELPSLPGEVLDFTARRAAWRRWLIGLAFGVGVFAVVFAVAWFLGPGPTPNLSNSSPVINTTSKLLPWVLLPILLFASLALLRFGWRGDRTVLLPPADPLPTGYGLRLFDEGALQGPLRVMGSQRRALGRWLDLPGTIHRTVRAAGWPHVVRGGRVRTPEHLVLVHLTSADDPQRLVAAALLDRLRGADLRATAFGFVGAVDWLQPWNGGAPLPLAQVAAQNANSRLIVLSDGAPFYDPFGNTACAPRAFDEFPVRVLVIPVPRTAWSWREAALDRGGWRLAEQSTEGVADLARWLSGPRETLPPLPPQSSPLDLASLLARDENLFAEEPPSSALRVRLIDQLAQWLDPDPRQPPVTFDLLRVLATGVRLSPGTVERVAAHVASLGGPQPEEITLLRLLRLPWFARGGLPGWLREDLQRGMPVALADTARRAWLLHLADRNPDKGMLSPAQETRLTAEVRRRLAYPGALVDDWMRSQLGLTNPPTRRLDWRANGLVVAAAVGVTAACWGLIQLGSRLLVVGNLVFVPLAPLVRPGRPWLAGLAVMLAAILVWLPPPPALPRLPPFVRPALACLAVYFALGAAWMATTSPNAAMTDIVGGYAIWVGATITSLSLVTLAHARPVRSDRLLPSVLLPGHPWLNAAALSLIALLIVSEIFLRTDEARPDVVSILVLLGGNAGRAVLALLLGAAVAPRLVRSGLVAERDAWRLPVRFAAGIAAANGLLTFPISFAAGQGQSIAQLGILAGSISMAVGVAIALATYISIPWRIVAIGLTTTFIVFGSFSRLLMLASGPAAGAAILNGY
jgi:hypothetical protein